MFSIHNVFGRDIGTSGFDYPSVEQKPAVSLDTQTADQDAVEKAFARVFSTDDGQVILSHLQSMTFQRALGPDATDTQLRYLEGQRAMIATIMRLIRSGRDGGKETNHH